ncbi:MAG: hypothetical protein WCJ49_02570 [Deltaproteobacteria bacterium]
MRAKEKSRRTWLGATAKSTFKTSPDCATPLAALIAQITLGGHAVARSLPCGFNVYKPGVSLHCPDINSLRDFATNAATPDRHPPTSLQI